MSDPEIPYRCWPGLRTRELTFDVPLDHGRPDGPRISLFARALQSTRARGDEPWLVFLQGGPGFESPRPDSRGGWIGRALDDYRVLLLDQRGTGRSAPIEIETLLRLASDDERVAHLRHFRADSIVRDCELVRRELAGDDRWALLGQSFGGFCATSYLSLAPDGLREVYIAGGLPPMVDDAALVYEALLPELERRTQKYFTDFPEDRERFERLVGLVRGSEVRLPRGGRLSVRRLQSLGHELGMSSGPARVHHLLERAFDGERLTYAFRRGLEDLAPFDTNPCYALLHEPCYAQGFATRWAAERALETRGVHGPDAAPDGLTSEMVLRATFEDHAGLEALLPTAELLAEVEDWPELYDLERLAANEVPTVAVVYADDLYVDRDLSLATADVIRGTRVWLTNEYEHDGLRAEGGRILDRLIAMRRGDA